MLGVTLMSSRLHSVVQRTKICSTPIALLSFDVVQLRKTQQHKFEDKLKVMPYWQCALEVTCSMHLSY